MKRVKEKQEQCKCKFNLKFEDVHLIYKDKRVTWEYIGEGEDGDYNPKDKHDIPLLRFSCDQMVEPDPMAQFGGLGGWEGMENASYCTQMPIDTPMKVLVKGLAEIMEAIQDENYKRRLEELSWMSPKNVKGLVI